MVNWFSYILGLGISLGLAWIAWKAPRNQVTRRLDQSLVWLVGCLLAARVGFVAAYWSYYRMHWVEIPQIWLGGLSAFGALAGGWVTWLILARIQKRNPGLLADELLPLGMFLSAAIWLACWINGMAYGILAFTAWWGVPAPDEWGTWLNRFPVQFLAAVLILAAFFGITRLQNRLPKSGEAASLGLLTLTLSSLGLSFLRADPAPTWSTWRYDTLASFLSSLIATGLCLLAFWPKRKEPSHLSIENSDSTYETNHCSCSN